MVLCSRCVELDVASIVRQVLFDDIAHESFVLLMLSGYQRSRSKSDFRLIPTCEGNTEKMAECRDFVEMSPGFR